MHLRPWLTLARASNLPTVWSNCIAAAVIAGASDWTRTALVSCAATFLYTAGMFLNDVCDVRYDERFNRMRPIVAGEISRVTAAAAALLLLLLGLLVCWCLGQQPMLYAACIAVVVVVYDLTHKHISFGALLMATCRFLLYPLAGSSVAAGASSRIWLPAGGLACYVAAISFAARGERTQAPRRFAARWLLFVPAIGPLVMHGTLTACLYLSVFVGWTVRASSLLKRDTPRAVSMLLAGVVLLDMANVSSPSLIIAAGFVLLFVTAILFQRYVPAT